MTTAVPEILVPPIVSMVTDRHRYEADAAARSVDGLIDDAARAAAAGVTLIQVRERGLDDRGLLDLVSRIRARTGGRARVLVNRRTDVVLAAGADGVHLPADAPLASRVRRLLPAGSILGRSVHSVEEAAAAERDGACDYLTFGTVYPSVGKPADHVAAGVEALRSVCRAVRLPVLAIGGIRPERGEEVAAAGAAGVAAIGMFVTRPGDDGAEQMIKESIARLRVSFDQGVAARLQ